MAITKKQVFLSSRFEEFKELRTHVSEQLKKFPQAKLEAVNLDIDRVSHNSPLTESLTGVNDGELYVLFLGDTYGSIQPGNDVSYTHAEYLEASKNESNKKILVFAIGELYKNNKLILSDDPHMREFQELVFRNHIVSMHGSLENEELLAVDIAHKILAAHYELEFGLGDTVDESGDASDLEENDDGLDENDTAEITLNSSIDSKKSLKRYIDANLTNQEMIKNPGLVKCMELNRDAIDAVQINDFSIAVTLFKRSLEIKPLNIIANYWLAKIYIHRGNKQKIIEGIEILGKLLRVIDKSDVKLTSLSFQLLSMGNYKLEMFSEALIKINGAISETPYVPSLYISKSIVELNTDFKEDFYDTVMKSISVVEQNYALSLTQKSNLLNSFIQRLEVNVDKESMDKVLPNLKKSIRAINEDIDKLNEFSSKIINEYDLQDEVITFEITSMKRYGLSQVNRKLSNIPALFSILNFMYLENDNLFESRKKIIDEDTSFSELVFYSIIIVGILIGYFVGYLPYFGGGGTALAFIFKYFYPVYAGNRKMESLISLNKEWKDLLSEDGLIKLYCDFNEMAEHLNYSRVLFASSNHSDVFRKEILLANEENSSILETEGTNFDASLPFEDYEKFTPEYVENISFYSMAENSTMIDDFFNIYSFYSWYLKINTVPFVYSNKTKRFYSLFHPTYSFLYPDGSNRLYEDN